MKVNYLDFFLCYLKNSLQDRWFYFLDDIQNQQSTTHTFCCSNSIFNILLETNCSNMSVQNQQSHGWYDRFDMLILIYKMICIQGCYNNKEAAW